MSGKLKSEVIECLRREKKHHREDENLEVQTPLKGKIDLHMRERKPIDISNI